MSEARCIEEKDVNEFCKLFDTEHGQILVKIDRNAECVPEVRFWAQPPGLGVCSIAAGYKDDDEGWDRAEAYFASVDSVRALKAVAPLLQMANGDSIGTATHTAIGDSEKIGKVGE